MVLKLHSGHHPGGGNGIVGLVLAEKQIPFELVHVDMAAKEHKTPEHLAKQPFGQVPYIVRTRQLNVDEVALAGYVEELREKLKVYDVILGKQKYVAGDVSRLLLQKVLNLTWASQEFTLADIFHLMYMPMVVSNGIDVVTTSGPNVAR
ncbi:hypothetical protein FB45DRAFT_352399 [Roridomyces roridus]|uniref:glutathione transferase n=1 Tax=Roridomyces roridus TaxID=1738132 RepID=A0AAD7C6Y0_9AGAR|nr:hypothetical protein FB45DRAFT_352399 [Roridomyces roridus]